MKNDEQECKYCGEFVKKVAKKCRHCGEWLKRGVAPRQRGTRMAGETVIVPLNGEIMTAGCVMCGRESARPVRKKFQYTPSWIYLTALIALLLTIILSAILTKRSQVSIMLCAACKSAWTTASVVYFSFVIIGLFGVPAIGAFLLDAIIGGDAGIFGGIGGFVLWLVLVIVLGYAYKNKKQAVCKLIDDRAVTLKFPNPSQVESLMRKAERDDA